MRPEGLVRIEAHQRREVVEAHPREVDVEREDRVDLGDCAGMLHEHAHQRVGAAVGLPDRVVALVAQRPDADGRVLGVAERALRVFRRGQVGQHDPVDRQVQRQVDLRLFGRRGANERGRALGAHAEAHLLELRPGVGRVLTVEDEEVEARGGEHVRHRVAVEAAEQPDRGAALREGVAIARAPHHRESS